MIGIRMVVVVEEVDAVRVTFSPLATSSVNDGGELPRRRAGACLQHIATKKEVDNDDYATVQDIHYVCSFALHPLVLVK